MNNLSAEQRYELHKNNQIRQAQYAEHARHAQDMKKNPAKKSNHIVSVITAMVVSR